MAITADSLEAHRRTFRVRPANLRRVMWLICDSKNEEAIAAARAVMRKLRAKEIELNDAVGRLVTINRRLAK